jgi:hypothetical protein
MSDNGFPQRLVDLRRWMQLVAAGGAVVLAAGLWFVPGRAWPDLLLGLFIASF